MVIIAVKDVLSVLLNSYKTSPNFSNVLLLSNGLSEEVRNSYIR